jgi:hypothetical protein
MTQGWDVNTILFGDLKDVLAFFALYGLSIQFERYHVLSSFLDLANLDGIKFTGVVANAALDAFFLIDDVQFFLFTGYGLLRALPKAHMASGAVFLVDFIMKQRFAYAGRTFLVPNVGLVFITEIKNIG